MRLKYSKTLRYTNIPNIQRASFFEPMGLDPLSKPSIVTAPKDAYRQKTINMELAKLTGIKGVPVPARPAQPQSPGRTKKVSPGRHKTKGWTMQGVVRLLLPSWNVGL